MKTHILLAALCGILASCSALGPEVSGNPPSCPQDGLPMTLHASLFMCPNGHVGHNVGGLPSFGMKASKKALSGAEYPLQVVNNHDSRGRFITPKRNGQLPLWQASVYQSPDGVAYQSPWIQVKP